MGSFFLLPLINNVSEYYVFLYEMFYFCTMYVHKPSEEMLFFWDLQAGPGCLHAQLFQELWLEFHLEKPTFSITSTMYTILLQFFFLQYITPQLYRLICVKHSSTSFLTELVDLLLPASARM